MELDFNKIIRLKKIRIEKSELSEEENTLASPILRDKSLIRGYRVSLHRNRKSVKNQRANQLMSRGLVLRL